MPIPSLPALLALAAPGAHAAQVPCPSELDDVHDAAQLALDAYAVMDTDRLFEHHRQTREAVSCLEVLVEPEDAAAIHGVTGLAAFLTEDDAGTLAAFAAALASDPSWTLPERVAPEGSVLVELQAEAATLGAGPELPMPNVDGFVLMVDGEPSLERPADRPCLLQVLTEDWEVIWSGVLEADDDLPPAALDPARFARGSSALAQALGDDVDYDRNITGRLAYGAAGFGAVALGLITASTVASAKRAGSQRQCIEDAACVDDEDAWTERMDGLHQRSVAYGWSGAGCAVVAAGLGVGAVVEWRF
jgi:hypothetical protein